MEAHTMSASGKWGKEPLDFIFELQDKRVLISLANGKAFKGTLIGADPYSLVLRQDSGLEIMINKGNVVYLHATTK
jgi:small nuclear ribonucleoprotein (snRNP)-like protein